MGGAEDKDTASPSLDQPSAEFSVTKTYEVPKVLHQRTETTESLEDFDPSSTDESGGLRKVRLQEHSNRYVGCRAKSAVLLALT